MNAHLCMGLVILFAVTGCAQDTDTLVCSPEKTKVGGQCVTVDMVEDQPCVDVMQDMASTDAADLAMVMEPCVDWSFCADGLYCAQVDEGGLRRCQARCETEPCASGRVCTLAGICLTPGDALEDQDCGLDACTDGLACDPDSLRCRPICDPRQPACADDTICVPSVAGLGLCLRRCD